MLSTSHDKLAVANDPYFSYFINLIGILSPVTLSPVIIITAVTFSTDDNLLYGKVDENNIYDIGV